MKLLNTLCVVMTSCIILLLSSEAMASNTNLAQGNQLVALHSGELSGNTLIEKSFPKLSPKQGFYSVVACTRPGNQIGVLCTDGFCAASDGGCNSHGGVSKGNHDDAALKHGI